MQRTLLEIVTSFTERRALPIPAAVIGSTEFQVRQIRALLEEGCEALSQRGPWESLQKEAVITTVALENQGALESLAPGYRWLLPATLWDRTNRRTLVGRMTPAMWQWVKAIIVAGPLYTFRIMGGNFLVNPVPPVGDTWVFEYVMETWAQETGGNYVKYFTADDNLILLPDNIVLADLTWRYKKERGLAYAQDFEDCERTVIDTLGKDGGPKPPLDMAGCDDHYRPTVMIPKYNTVP